MVDAETVERRLRHMAHLRDIGAQGRDAFMSDEMVQAAAERRLQVAIQAALDVANHILAEDSDVTPDEYAAAFVELGKLGVIDKDLADRLGSAAGQRNPGTHVRRRRSRPGVGGAREAR